MFRCCECTLLKNSTPMITDGGGTCCDECWPYVQKASTAAVQPANLNYEALHCWYKDAAGGSYSLGGFKDWLKGMGGLDECVRYFFNVRKAEWDAALKKAQGQLSCQLTADLETRTKAVIAKILKYCGVSDIDAFTQRHGGVMPTKDHLVRHGWTSSSMKSIPRINEEWPT